MPYAPGIEYRGDQYIAQGIGSFGRSIAGGIEDWQKKHDETQQKLETADLLKDYADKRGFTTPEFQAKYAAANAEQRSKMAAGLSQTIVLQAHAKDLQDELANKIKVAQITADARSPGEAVGFDPPGVAALQTQLGEQGQMGVFTPSRDGKFRLQQIVPKLAKGYGPPAAMKDIGGGVQYPVDAQGNPVGAVHYPPAPNPIYGLLGGLLGVDPGAAGGGAPGSTFNVTTPGGGTTGKPVDQATAASILQEVGGDPIKAAALAKQRGYTF